MSIKIEKKIATILTLAAKGWPARRSKVERDLPASVLFEQGIRGTLGTLDRRFKHKMER
jgi:hypothetical protein